MKLLRMDTGDGGTLGVWLFKNSKYEVIVNNKRKIVEMKKFNILAKKSIS